MKGEYLSYDEGVRTVDWDLLLSVHASGACRWDPTTL